MTASPAKARRPSDAAQALAHELRGAFFALPPSLKARCRYLPSGDATRDRPVWVFAGDYSEDYRGVIVAGLRDDDGDWLLDTDFRLLTFDGDGPGATLITVHGGNCHVELL